jgi:hypothetical protein
MDTRAITQNLVSWKVCDSILPPLLLEKVETKINSSQYSYGWVSLPGDPHGHWHHEFTNTGRFNEAECSHLLTGPVSECWDFLRAGYLSRYPVLLRCYLNGYTYGTDGYAHTDSDHSDCATMVFYNCKEWYRDWGGETVLFNGEDVAMSVMPKRNRGFLFLSNIPHAARSVSRKCSILRTTLMFKSRSIRSDDYEMLSRFLVKNGATKHKHKRGTLHDHLMRTYSLLESRVSRNVALAGGLHSVYGSNVFPHKLFGADSSIVLKHFGDQVDGLARMFCTSQRPACFESGDGIPCDVLKDMRMIEAANLLDQGELEKWPKIMAQWKSHVGSGA